MLTSQKGKQPEKFMLGCLNDKHSWSREGHQLNICHQQQSLKSLWEYRSHLLSKLHIKVLAKAGPDKDPIATPSSCW